MTSEDQRRSFQIKKTKNSQSDKEIEWIKKMGFTGFI